MRSKKWPEMHGTTRVPIGKNSRPLGNQPRTTLLIK